MKNEPAPYSPATTATMATSTPLTFRTAHLIPVDIGISADGDAAPCAAGEAVASAPPPQTTVTTVSDDAPTRETSLASYEASLVRWLYEHPPRNVDRDVCAGCGKPLGENYVPLLDGAWVHLADRCWRTYGARRRKEAIKALRLTQPNEREP